MRPMAKRVGVSSTIVAMTSLASACTTVLYKGPQRPASEIAVLVSKDTMIDKVDSLIVRDNASGNSARFEVLPGDHEVGISLMRKIPGFLTTKVQHSGYIVLCLTLEGGHTYRSHAVIDGQHWTPIVVDETARRPIDGSCDKASERADAAASAPPVEPSGSPVIAVDPDEPQHQPVAAAAHAGASSADAEVSGRRPGSGLSLFTGFAFGGDDFVKATTTSGNDETLSSGQGFILGIGAMVTPLWPSDLIGFGVGVDGALKYDSVDASNGSASITRFPLALTAHLLTGPDGSHFFLFKGGVARDFGVHYSASGFDMIDADAKGEWGPTGAFGYYKRSNDNLAWDILAVFTLTNHLVGGEKINANSFGLTVGVHLNL